MAPTAAAKSSTKKDNKSGQKQAANKPVKLSPDQRYYAVDAEKLTCLQEEKPWMKSAIYFQSVAVSPSAVTKMMMHCASGVEKGIAKGGNPIEGTKNYEIYLALLQSVLRWFNSIGRSLIQSLFALSQSWGCYWEDPIHTAPQV